MSYVEALLEGNPSAEMFRNNTCTEMRRLDVFCLCALHWVSLINMLVYSSIVWYDTPFECGKQPLIPQEMGFLNPISVFRNLLLNFLT
jgi:hypothetical protein